jgi:hypothetical protein
MTCVAYLKWKKEITGKEKIIALTGAAVAASLLLLKIIPQMPGSLGRWEYLALAVWLAIGLGLRKK